MSALLVQACGSCGAVALARRRHCPRCGSGDFGPRTIDGRGRVFSATTVHRAPGPSPIGPAPYTIVLVALDVAALDKVMALAHAPLAIDTPVIVRPLTPGEDRAPYIAEPA